MGDEYRAEVFVDVHLKHAQICFGRERRGIKLFQGLSMPSAWVREKTRSSSLTAVSIRKRFSHAGRAIRRAQHRHLVPPYETGGKFHGVSSASSSPCSTCASSTSSLWAIPVAAASQLASTRAPPSRPRRSSSRAGCRCSTMRLRVLAAHPNAPHSERLSALEKEGVKTSIKHLRTFPFITDAENKGKLALHGAYFDIATGTLSVLNHSRNEFFPL